MPRVFTLLLVSAAAGCGPTTGRGLPTHTGTPDLDYPVGAFALTERSGRTVTDADLRGKVWVASFVFTRCSGPCPAVTATVARLQSELPAAELPDVRFVTYTVDPKRDRPEELNEYAARHRADPARWLFLTGEEKSIHTLMRDRFKLAIGRSEAAGAKAGEEFDHSTRLTLVDKNGVIRATCDGMRNDQRPDADAAFEDGLKRFKEKVRKLSAE